jgi:AcrR family transcriptional regulator
MLSKVCRRFSRNVLPGGQTNSGGHTLTAEERIPDPIGSWSMNEGLDEILMKSCKLIATRGFHGTSMRDLAQETGRSLSGLYHYFKNKEDLLFLINLYGFTTLNETWRRLDEKIEPPHEKLYAFIYMHVTYFVNHMYEMRVMIWGTQELNLAKVREIQKLKDRYAGIVEQIVQEVFDTDNPGTADEKRVSRETYLLFGMMNWMYSWYSPATHGIASDLINDIYRTFLNGISESENTGEDLVRFHANVSNLYGKYKTQSMWTPTKDGAE